MLADFLPTLPVLAGYTLAAIVLGLTPGPDMTFFLSRTIAQSRAAGTAALFGASTGLVIHTVLVAAGLSVLLAASATAFTILKFGGAAYLVWLAIDAVRNGSALSLNKGGRSEPLRATYLKALMVNLLNPKVIIFFVTFLPQFVSPHDPHAAQKLLFLGLYFTIVNIPVCFMLILFAEQIARLIRRSPATTRFVDWLFAGVLGAFAVKLVLTEAR